jgi:hypothetical protein
MVLKHAGDHASQWSIAAKIGCTAETLGCCVRRPNATAGKRVGPTSEQRDRIKALERESGSCAKPTRSCGKWAYLP